MKKTNLFLLLLILLCCDSFAFGMIGRTGSKRLRSETPPPESRKRRRVGGSATPTSSPEKRVRRPEAVGSAVGVRSKRKKRKARALPPFSASYSDSDFMPSFKRILADDFQKMRLVEFEVRPTLPRVSIAGDALDYRRLPEWIGSCTNMKKLSLACQVRVDGELIRFGSTALAPICNLKKLRSLTLINPASAGAFLVKLTTDVKLRSLCLRRSDVSTRSLTQALYNLGGFGVDYFDGYLKKLEMCSCSVVDLDFLIHLPESIEKLVVRDCGQIDTVELINEIASFRFDGQLKNLATVEVDGDVVNEQINDEIARKAAPDRDLFDVLLPDDKAYDEEDEDED